MKSLQSSAERKGKIITEIITCNGGYKKTFRGILSETIEQGEFTKFETEDGRLVMVNTANVLFVEIF